MKSEPPRRVGALRAGGGGGGGGGVAARGEYDMALARRGGGRGERGELRSARARERFHKKWEMTAESDKGNANENDNDTWQMKMTRAILTTMAHGPSSH